MTRTLALSLAALFALAPARAGADDRGGPDEGERSNFWERVLEPNRDEYLAKVDHARELLGKGDRRALERAGDQLREAGQLVPDQPLAHFWLGRVHYRRAFQLAGGSRPRPEETVGAWEDCAEALTRVHDLDDSFRPDDREPGWTLDFELARCLAGAGDYEGAIDHLKQILSRGVTEVDRVHFLLAEVYMALGRLEDAIGSFRTARSLRAPHDAESNFALAVAYDRAERIARAREHMRAALRREPSLNSLWAHGKVYVPPIDEAYYLGLAYRAKEDHSWALYHFRRYLAFAEEPWKRRARAHLTDLKEYEVGSDLVVKGTASVNRERAAAVVARADAAFQKCVEATPNLLLEVRITRHASGERGRGGEAGGKRAGARVVPQRHFGHATPEIRDAIDCARRVAEGLDLPEPKGSGGTYARVRFKLIAR